MWFAGWDCAQSGCGLARGWALEENKRGRGGQG